MTNTSLRYRWRTVFAASAVAVFWFAVAPVAAHADSSVGASVVTVGGVPLDGSLQPSSFTATVSAPAGVKSVKFVLDGVYLGQTSMTPYRFTITTGGGLHRLAVHWDDPVSQRLTVAFTGTGPVVAAQKPPTNPKKPKGGTGNPPPLPAPTQPAPTLPPAPQAPPLGTGVISVSSSAQLVGALATALPGQTILLANGSYVGKFIASASGRLNAPITLRGSRAAVLSAGGISAGYGLHVTGSYWVIQGISVTASGKGIVLDGSQHTVLSGIDVGNIGDEGVHFRHNSSFSSIIASTVHDTGLKAPGFGEGIYIGSAHSNWATVMGSASTPDSTNYVVVEGNHIVSTTAEGVDVKEGTTGGALVGNVFTNSGYSGANSGDSWIDVKGNSYLVSGNSGTGTKTDAFQVHQAVSGWGNNNVFESNSPVVGVPGYLVNVGPRVTGTVVKCQPTTAALGLSNIVCSN